MCKHILINQFHIEDMAILSDFANRTHDRDGFGAIIRTTSGQIETKKTLSIAEFYIWLSLRATQGDISTLVVHHRTSTNMPGVDYAHPFEFQGHWLTHNGVIQVPGSHATKTQNDSELLLHHLIKTNWHTESISGYFSCFVLTENETTILVDDIAPIHSNGRIFSSHNLGPSFYPVKLQRITLDASGKELDRCQIETTKSTYGQDRAHLSLGWSNGVSRYEPIGYEPIGDGYSFQDSTVDAFIGGLTYLDEDRLLQCSHKKFAKNAQRLASTMGLTLTPDDIAELEYYFFSNNRINA